jgi:hypothetical protein
MFRTIYREIPLILKTLTLKSIANLNIMKTLQKNRGRGTYLAEPVFAG